MGTSSSKFEIIQNTLSKSGNRLSVSSLCEIAGVSRSGYYKIGSNRRKQDTSAMSRIKTILSLSWLHTTSVATKKEHAAFICACSIKIRQLEWISRRSGASWTNSAWLARFEKQIHTEGCYRQCGQAISQRIFWTGISQGSGPGKSSWQILHISPAMEYSSTCPQSSTPLPDRCWHICLVIPLR